MASNNIKGLTVEIGGNVTGLETALKDVEKPARSAQSELREINKLLKLDPGSTELLAQKQTALSESIDGTKKKLELLRNAEKTAREQLANKEIGADQFRALQREIVKAEQQLSGFEQELKDMQNASEDAGDAVEVAGEQAAAAAEQTEDLSKKNDALKESYDKARDSAKDAGKELGATLGVLGGAAVGAATVAMGYEDALAAVQIQTGATAEQMAIYREAMDAVFAGGYGEDMDAVASTMARIAQVTGETDPSKLQELTENALTLQDAFDFGAEEQLRAVDQLTTQFGVSAAEAYNLIVQGAQRGLNKNGDLLDVINEYSVHYKNLGYSAEEFFGSLENGTKTGTFSVDKLGDAMKEFGVRVKDTSTTTTDALAALGYSAEEVAALQADLLTGGEAAREASEDIYTRLFAMEDAVAQNQAGVALFGTMWEDLGADAIAAITDVNTTLDSTQDAMQEIKDIRMNTTSAQWEQMGRTVQQELIIPLGKDLLPVAKQFFSYCIDNSDKLIPLVKTLAAVIVTMFVVNKVAKFTQSIKSLVSAYKSLTAAATASNAAQSSNIWGLIATAIAAVIALFSSLIKSEIDAKQAAKEHAAAVAAACDEQTAAYREVADAAWETARAQRETAKEIASEYGAYHDLWEELESLVDSNGRVLKGNEDRVEFIRGALSEALGEEIELVDGQIQKYDELADSINNLLYLQQAQALASEYEYDYKAAKSELTTLQNSYEAANATWYESQDKAQKLAVAQQHIASWVQMFETGAIDADTYRAETEQLLGEINEYKGWLEEHANAREDMQLKREAYDEALGTIKRYESLLAAIESQSSTQLLGAMDAYESNLITTATGAATSSLLLQTQRLYDDYQSKQGFLQTPGTSITQDQVDDAEDLLRQSLTEAIAAASAEGAEQVLTELREIASAIGYNVDESGSDEPITFARTPMTRMRPLAALQQDEPLAVYDDLMRVLPAGTASGTGAVSLAVEDEYTRRNAELSEQILRTLQDTDFTLVLEDGVVAGKILQKTDQALGRAIANQKRGALK